MSLLQQQSVVSLNAAEGSFLQKINKEDIRLVYTFEKLLGEGGFGSVRLASKTSMPDSQFAVKSIERDEINVSDLESELAILLAVDHPYIAKFYEAFLDHKYVHLVVEYCKGGDLSTMIEQKGKLEEPKVKRIVK